MTYHHKAFDLHIESDIRLTPLPLVEFAPPAISIRRGTLAVAPLFEPANVYRGGIQAQFAQDTNTAWLDWPSRARFAATDGYELIVDTPLTDPEKLAVFVLTEALGLLLFQRGYFLLHGSAVVIDGKGVVFLGQPGAGKSTTVAALARHGLSVASDDLVCLRVSADGPPTLIPSFNQLKIWDTAVAGLKLDRQWLRPVSEGLTKFSWHSPTLFTSTPVPLERLYVLTSPQPGSAGEQLFNQQEALITLLKYFPLPSALLQGNALKNHFTNSSRIVCATPVFALPRPADFAELDQLAARLHRIPPREYTIP